MNGIRIGIRSRSSIRLGLLQSLQSLRSYSPSAKGVCITESKG